jgi:hypothetical protein
LSLPAAEAKLPYAWHQPAVRLYANWLSYLAERRCSSHSIGKSDSAIRLR